MTADKSGREGTRLYFDSRWRGSHGIGRYSDEVRSRTRIHFEDFTSSLSATSPFDALNFSRFKLQSNTVIYSPGFNAGIASVDQIPTVHDLILMDENSTKSNLHKLYFDRVVRPAIRKSKLVFTVSQTSKAELQEWIGDESVTVANTGNGVSEIFHLGGLDRNFKKGNNILFVGNLRKHKNLITLLDAVKKLQWVNLRLVVPLSESEEVWRSISYRSMSHRCRVESNLTDHQLLRAYKESDLLAFPSTKEGFGLPAAESVSAGTPVVYATQCKSVAEIVGEFGFGVDSALDSDMWSEAIQWQLKLANTVEPSENWRSRYLWGTVAEKIDQSLNAWLANRDLGDG
jgi:glycosyltransferase involved in cell wall biosynthesis